MTQASIAVARNSASKADAIASSSGATIPRILLFTDADVFAGTERHMLDLARALLELGIPVQIACPRPGVLAERADGCGIPVVAIPKQGRVDGNAIRILVSLLRLKQIDVIHAHNGRTHIAAAFAVKKAGRGACIATQHFLQPARTGRSGLKAQLARFLHRRAARFTAHTIAISDAVRQAAIERGDVPANAITTVHNGIYPPDVLTAPTPQSVRHSLNLSVDTPFVFCAARLQVEKDVATLIAAMPQVAAAIPNIRCLIAGEGEEKTSIEAGISNNSLTSHVQLLGFRADVPALIRACDVFVNPCPVEGFGLVIVEAMALGKPVIATRAGGPCEIVDHNVTGLLTNPRDPQDLAAAIIRLLSDAALRSRFGEAGRNRFLQHFTAQRMAAETLAVYQAAMEHVTQ